jgi:hypothetical protein
MARGQFTMRCLALAVAASLMPATMPASAQSPRPAPAPIAAPAPAAAPLPPTAAGLWEQFDDETKRVLGWFLIYENNGVYEGAIAKMFIKPGENPNPICDKCEGDQKNQPSFGLVIIKNMQRKDNDYENGTILDPRDGNVYKARMELSPDGQQLGVRGYLGISLFGRTQTWKRLPDTALPLAEAPPNLRSILEARLAALKPVPLPIPRPAGAAAPAR